MTLLNSSIFDSSNYYVLLIESDPEEIELYSELIRSVANCKIDVLSRVGASFDWIERSNYQLVIIDRVALSGNDVEKRANGLALLEGIRRVNPETSVILISEEPSVEEAVSAIRLGAEDYIPKPVNRDNFKLAVKRGLDKKMVYAEGSDASSVLMLLNSCQMISATLDQSKIFKIIQSFFSRVLGSKYSAIYASDDKGARRIKDESPHIDKAMIEILDIAVHASNPFTVMRESGEMYRFMDKAQLTPGLFIFRFQCVEMIDYFCVCLSPTIPQSVDSFENQLKMLKTQIEVTGRNIKQYMGVRQLVYVDDATGLYNTRYLNNILDREVAQANATGKAFAVLFIDADKFKSINDTHGHLVGTKILNEMGKYLQKYVRGTDTVFRYGGDEFVAVLSPCDLPTAKVVAERIRSAVEKTAFLAEEKLNLHFTVSIGVALFPDHANSKKAMIDIADKAMYKAKKKSRNTVHVAGPDLGEAAAAEEVAFQKAAAETATKQKKA